MVKTAVATAAALIPALEATKTWSRVRLSFLRIRSVHSLKRLPYDVRRMLRVYLRAQFANLRFRPVFKGKSVKEHAPTGTSHAYFHEQEICAERARNAPTTHKQKGPHLSQPAV